MAHDGNQQTPKRMKRIAIFGNTHQQKYLEALGMFLRLLSEQGFAVSIEHRFGTYLQSHGTDLAGASIISELPADVECVISIGGDGTFLRTAQWIGNREVPIVGLNTGHLGFLAGYRLGDCRELAADLADNRVIYERRSTVQVTCDALPPGFWPYALNEVAVLKGDTASMVTVHANVDGDFLADYQSDGLVIATPTGSTAYNLSVGGPIMQPTLRCLVLSPIAPHSLTMRPLVISGDSHITLQASSRTDMCRVSLDGRSFMLPCDRELHICEAPFAIIVIRRPGSNYPRLLRNKLAWAT